MKVIKISAFVFQTKEKLILRVMPQPLCRKYRPQRAIKVAGKKKRYPIYEIGKVVGCRGGRLGRSRERTLGVGSGKSGMMEGGSRGVRDAARSLGVKRGECQPVSEYQSQCTDACFIPFTCCALHQVFKKKYINNT